MFKKRPLTARRPVVGYEGIYEVSNDGKVYRIRTQSGNHSGRELRLTLGKLGYYQVQLTFRRQRRLFRVHRLVATAFLENPDNLPVVNHKDCNPQNNHVSNLEWCTYAQNTHHAQAMGRMPMKKFKDVVPSRFTNKRPCKSFTWRYEVI